MKPRPQPIGFALLAASAVFGLWLAPRIFLAAWLAAWWWCLGLVLGVFLNAWMHRLSAGAWGEPLRACAPLLARRMPALFIALLPVAAGMHWLYPWAGDASGAWLHGIARPSFLGHWLSPTFFLARLVVYAAVWWWLTRPASMQRKGRAAASLLVHAAVSSLAAIDLLMSLVPAWYSTAFGLVTLSVQALSGAALVTLLATATPERLRGTRDVPITRDLGNLLLMWTMTWAYLAFMQFLIIWAENLPREIAWYVPRLQTGWTVVGLALVLLQLTLPSIALLFRCVKDSPERLAKVALLLLATSALDTVWTVLPSVDAHTLQGWWLAPCTFAGLALVLFGSLLDQWRQQPAPQPMKEGHAPS